MTQDEIIEMAREAGFDEWQSKVLFDHALEAFAKLVATKAIAELESQEPVAWKWRVKNFCDWPNWSVSLKRPADSGHAQYPRTEGYEDIPLYTHPPAQPAQRTWVGLTDDERYDIRASFVGNFWETCVFAEQVQLATEAKLKEKNT